MSVFRPVQWRNFDIYFYLHRRAKTVRCLRNIRENKMNMSSVGRFTFYFLFLKLGQIRFLILGLINSFSRRKRIEKLGSVRKVVQNKNNLLYLKPVNWSLYYIESFKTQSHGSTHNRTILMGCNFFVLF